MMLQKIKFNGQKILPVKLRDTKFKDDLWIKATEILSEEANLEKL